MSTSKQECSASFEPKSPAEFTLAVDRLHVATINALTRRLESGIAFSSDQSNAACYLRATKRTV